VSFLFLLLKIFFTTKKLQQEINFWSIFNRISNIQICQMMAEMAGWGFSEILKNKNLCVTP